MFDLSKNFQKMSLAAARPLISVYDDKNASTGTSGVSAGRVPRPREAGHRVHHPQRDRQEQEAAVLRQRGRRSPDQRRVLGHRQSRG